MKLTTTHLGLLRTPGTLLAALGLCAGASAQSTLRVDVSSANAQAATGGSNAHISADGRFIAFVSTSALVAGDTNGDADIYVRDRLLGTTARVSLPDPSTGDTDGNAYSGLCHNGARCMSDDGRYVIFHSAASDLVANDTNDVEDIFVRDRDTDGNGIFDEAGAGKTRTVRVSLTSSESQSSGSCPNQTCTHQSYNGTISGNGRYVAWESSFDFTADNAPFSNVYWRDRDADADGIYDESGSVGLVDQAVTKLASKVQTCNGCTYDGFSAKAAISGNGRFVAFESNNSHLIFSDTNNVIDVFVRDMVENRTVRASRGTFDEQDTAQSTSPSISDDGRTIVFASINGWGSGTYDHVQIWEHNEDLDGDGNFAEAGDASTGLVSSGYFVFGGGHPTFNGHCSTPCVSGNGRIIAFASDATNYFCNIECDDQNGKRDVFVRNLYASGVGIARASVPAVAAESNGDSSSPTLTRDGTTVAFSSVATNMVMPDANGTTGDTFVRTGVYEPINSSCGSADLAPIGPGSISGETTGSFVGFEPPCTAAATSGPAAWYSYIPSCTGMVQIDTNGSAFDTALTVHTECPATEANMVACDDDSGDGTRSLVTFQAVAGVEYIVQVTSYGNTSGLYTLRLTELPTTNDVCSTAQTVSSGTTMFGTCDATTDGPGQQNCNGPQAFNRDVWFSWTAECTGNATVTTCGSSFDTVLAVYDSCPAGANTALVCNDDSLATCGVANNLNSAVTVQVTEGQVYKVRVGGYGLQSGSGVLNISCVPTPACGCDWNGFDGLDSQDFFDFLNDFFAGNADYNGVDGTDSQDYFDFLECFFTGCP